LFLDKTGEVVVRRLGNRGPKRDAGQKKTKRREMLLRRGAFMIEG
jgi:hypothetical protein